MGTNGLTFEQGVAVGIIVATKCAAKMRETLARAGSAEGAFTQGQNFFRELVNKYTDKVVPGFPQGIPREALEATDQIVETLVMAGEI